MEVVGTLSCFALFEIYFEVRGTELKTSCLLSKCDTTELQLQLEEEEAALEFFNRGVQ